MRPRFPAGEVSAIDPRIQGAFDAILNGVGRDKLFQGPYLTCHSKPKRAAGTDLKAG